jgi:ubiquinone/menaquinone biosynthesis C-methylase UbiE
LGRKVESVFDKYANEYDLITNAVQREAYHRKEIRAIIEKYRPGTVLDAGCASGLTAVLFAREGVKAVGLDRSRRMLEQADKNYGKSGLVVSFRYGRFEALPKSMGGKFDLVVCLANSISGLDSRAKLRRAIKNFFLVLRPGGTVLIQALNYAAVTENALLPIKATENDGIIWARYARRQGKRYAVHVIRFDMNVKPPGFEPFCHEFDNFSPVEIKTSMEKAGFKRIARFANLHFNKRFSETSRDLVIAGHRPITD